MAPASIFSGLLNINKPVGVTSRWVVDQVQRLVRPAKAGHAGTLDPLATGVLVVCVGQATRLIEYVQQMKKCYRAEFLLGKTSSTEDITGDVTELKNLPEPTVAQIEVAAAALTGEILQRPPAFSALKVSGRRAYDLARSGQTVELAPRPVTIYRLQLLQYDYPRLQLEVECSSGTYVRSLGRDLAESIGTGAVMSALERTAIGGFTVENAIDVQSLDRESIQQHILSPLRAVESLAKYQLSGDDQQRIARGQFIECESTRIASKSATPPGTRHPIESLLPNAIDPSEFAALDDCGNLAAILRRRENGLLQPAINFVAK